jgi:hypothetical protein
MVRPNGRPSSKVDSAYNEAGKHHRYRYYRDRLLAAFDIVYMIYGSSTGWPILGILVFQNISGGGMSMKGAA